MKKLKRWIPVVALFLMITLTVAVAQFVMAEGVETTVLPDNWASKDGVGEIVKFILNLVVYGLGAAAVLGTVIAGIMYMSARDSESQVAEAKKRLYNVAIGLAAWAVMFTALNWLIPGGILLGSSGDAGNGGDSGQPTQNSPTGGQLGGQDQKPNEADEPTNDLAKDTREDGSEKDIKDAEVGPGHEGHLDNQPFEGPGV